MQQSRVAPQVRDWQGRDGLRRLYGAALGVTLLLGAVAFQKGLLRLVDRWSNEEEYGHGPLLVATSIYFLWHQLPKLRAETWRPGWHGPALVLLAVLVYQLGAFGGLYAVMYVSVLLFLYGIGVAVVGLRPSRHLLIPLAMLAFAIPLPWYLQANLTAGLQLWSSQIGVMVLRIQDIPVFLEGNVIDLGEYQLQVVEACSGLRYLFPLSSLGFICACLYRAALWKRVVLVLATIPITILMNSLRIGIAGVLVDRYGIETAQGFIHDFEGWSIFAACLALLFLLIVLLSRVGKDRAPVREIFGLAPRPPVPAQPPALRPAPLVASLAVMVSAVALAGTVDERRESVPERTPLVMFPDDVGRWHGDPYAVDTEVLATLKLDDYLMSDYRAPGNAPINLWIAWYGSQRLGGSPHSPRVCIPGGGWEITEFSRETFGFTLDGRPLHYNRAVIAKGEHRQLVYYWFQGRGRSISNELLSRWYLLQDAILQNRSDIALVRLTTPLGAAERVDAAERRLTGFAYDILPKLPPYVPD